MGYFHIERGRLVEIPIDFVWYVADKLDLLDKASGGTFQIRRMREGFFEVRYGRINATVEIASIDASNKTVKFLINIGGLGSYVSAIWTFKLTSTSDGRTAAYSYVDLRPKGLARVVFGFLKDNFQKIADEMANSLERGAVVLFNKPDEYGIPQEIINRLAFRTSNSPKKGVQERRVDYEEPTRASITIKADNSTKLLTVMMEGSEHFPFKVFDEVKVDEKTLDNIMKEIESTANLANIWGMIRRGAEKSDDFGDFACRDLREQVKKFGLFMYSYLIPQNVAECISKEKDASCLWFEIDPRLLDIPWELMHTGKEFICLKHALGRKILTTEAPEITARKLNKKARFLLIGDPSEELPEAQREVALIESKLKKFPVDIDSLKGSNITKRDFLLALRNGVYDIIHYAGHAYFDINAPDESYLKFSGEVCYKYEIERFVKGNPPAIVYVNACSSAREKRGSQIKFEREIAGLAKAFVFGGCRGYIGSLWPVYDEDAATFAVQFYQQVLNGSTLGESLLQARRATYKKSGDKSLAWASFLLYGDPSLKLEAFSLEE